MMQLIWQLYRRYSVNKDFVLQAKWDFLEKSDQLIESINAFKKQKTGFSTIFVSKYNKIAQNTGIKKLVAKIEDVALWLKNKFSST
jgi:hypothetical protein